MDLKIGDIIINLYRESDNFTPGKAYRVLEVRIREPFPSAGCTGNNGTGRLNLWGGNNEKTDGNGIDAHYRLATCNDCAEKCKNDDIYILCKKFIQENNCAFCHSQCKREKPCGLFDGVTVVE